MKRYFWVLTAAIAVVLIIAVGVIKGSVHSSPTVAASYSAPTVPQLQELDIAKMRYLADNAIKLQHETNVAALAHRIDCYYDARGAPLKGYGRYVILSCERYAINPKLVVGISEAESTCGLACFAPFNFWGGMAYPHGFGSWEESIDTLVNWLHNYYGSPQTMDDCPGYCEGNGTTQTVNDVIEGL